MYSVNIFLLFLFVGILGGCGDNLIPSGDDKRPAVQAGSTGSSVSQNAAVFSVQDTHGNPVTLASALAGKRGVVLYFTMWCDVCAAHASSIQALIPSNPGIGFYLVDYVSGSVAQSNAAESGAGFAGSGFVTLADVNHQIFNNLQGAMGATVLIDRNGVIKMNEEYGTGAKLITALSALP
jgi:peroxiredoxin